MEFTINLGYVFLLLYAGMKGFTSAWISKREFRYPIWNGDGVQIERGLHHKIRAYARNFFVNPEWALMKAIAFGPVFLVTGKRHIHAFLPWKIQRPPAFCEVCSDTGEYPRNTFLLSDGMEVRRECSCQKTKPQAETPPWHCKVCLDTKKIGPNRPCPHCERREKVAAQPKSDGLSADDYDKAVLLAANVRKELADKATRLVDFGTRDTHKALAGLADEGDHRLDEERFADDPYGYLQVHDKLFCGDPYDVATATDRKSDHWRRKIQPTEMQIGDTILPVEVPRGHHNSWFLDKPLRVRAIALPFLVVEYGSDGSGVGSTRHVDSMDVRGIKFLAQRDATKNNRNNEGYQPLLNPRKLRKGDRFIVERLGVNTNEGYQPLLNPRKLRKGDRFIVERLGVNTDSSYRGDAYEVLEAPAILTEDYNFKGHVSGYLHPGDLAVKVRPLSWRADRAWREAMLNCEKLVCLPCNDGYVKATESKCPDILCGIGSIIIPPCVP